MHRQTNITFIDDASFILKKHRHKELFELWHFGPVVETRVEKSEDW